MTVTESPYELYQRHLSELMAGKPAYVRPIYAPSPLPAPTPLPGLGNAITPAVVEKGIEAISGGGGLSGLAELGGLGGVGPSSSSGTALLPTLEPMLPATGAAPSSVAAAAPVSGLTIAGGALAGLAPALIGSYFANKKDKPNRKYNAEEILAGLRQDEADNRSGKKRFNWLGEQISGWGDMDDAKRKSILDLAASHGNLSMPGYADRAGNTIERRPESLGFNMMAIKDISPGSSGWKERAMGAGLGPMNAAGSLNYVSRGMTPTLDEVNQSRLLSDKKKAQYGELLKLIKPPEPPPPSLEEKLGVYLKGKI